MKGKFIIDCYNNSINGWFHILPINDPEAEPLISQYNIAKHKYAGAFHNIFPYNNSWWCVVEAENVLDAIVIFSNIYRKEVHNNAFLKEDSDERKTES